MPFFFEQFERKEARKGWVTIDGKPVFIGGPGGGAGGSSSGSSGSGSNTPGPFGIGGRYGESVEQRQNRTVAEERAREGRANFIFQRMSRTPRINVDKLVRLGKPLTDAIEETFDKMSSYDRSFIEKDLVGVTFG